MDKWLQENEISEYKSWKVIDNSLKLIEMEAER